MTKFRAGDVVKVKDAFRTVYHEVGGERKVHDVFSRYGLMLLTDDGFSVWVAPSQVELVRKGCAPFVPGTVMK